MGAQLSNLDNEIKQKIKEIHQRDKEIKQKNKEIRQREEQKAHLQERLNKIESTLAYNVYVKTISTIEKIKDAITLKK